MKHLIYKILKFTGVEPIFTPEVVSVERTTPEEITKLCDLFIHDLLWLKYKNEQPLHAAEILSHAMGMNPTDPHIYNERDKQLTEYYGRGAQELTEKMNEVVAGIINE